MRVIETNMANLRLKLWLNIKVKTKGTEDLLEYYKKIFITQLDFY